VTYGYNFNEVDLKIPNIKNDAKIIVNSAVDPRKRTPCMECLGPRVVGATLPHCNHNDQNTIIAGSFKRIASETVQPSRSSPKAERLAFKKIMRKLNRFAWKWCKKNLVPLSVFTDFSLENWLSKTSYPKWRQDELREKWLDCKTPMEKRNFIVKCFMKDETYTDFKHARGIFSRSDIFKCLVGPIFKQIEHVVYEHPAFIKHVPVADRPKTIFDRLQKQGATFIATDYTAFESHFTRQIMENLEFVLYKYMTQNTAVYKEFTLIMDTVLAGKNQCFFKHFNMTINATRMSGEMCTSLGNGFSNLMLMLFACEQKGSKCEGFVEGDDGIFSINGPVPTTEDFRLLGFNIKLDRHQRLSTASFCGIVFDEVDLVNVTNPLEVLCGFGWSKTTYVGARKTRKDELLRSKSLSLLHQYPGCPIIQSLGQYGMRITKHVNLNRMINKERSLSMWDREQILSAMAAYQEGKLKPMPVPINTRMLVETLYGVSVGDQIQIEQYLDSLNKNQPLVHMTIDKNMHFSWRYFAAHYTTQFLGDYPQLNVPAYDNELSPGQAHIKLSKSLQNSGLARTVLVR
jgi:hypothetical protein